ncbi:MAG TPA: TolC family protein [Tepidisphaeraceae bacterium]|nr:TolC family protein [Tepidisphaeraceae bacterium]
MYKIQRCDQFRFLNFRPLNLFRISSFGFRILSLSLLVTIAGCIPSEQQEIARYRKVLDAHAPTTVPVRSSQTPLTLEQAFALVNQNNELLKQSGEDYLQAIIAKNNAFAAFLPTVDLSLGYSVSYNDHVIYGYTKGSSSTPPVPLSHSTISHSKSGTLGTQMNIFNGFRDVAALRQATDVIEQRKAALLDEQATLLLNVTQSYYLVLESEESARVLRDSLHFRHEEIRDMQARLKLGNARPLDLAQAQADEATTRASLRQAQTNAINARSELAYLIGVPAITGPLADRYMVPHPLRAEKQFETLAQSYREDLIAARAGVKVAQQGLKQAIGEYFPSVGINFNYFLFNEPGSLWTAGLTGHIPIFSAGTIEADIRTAWSVYRQTGLAESYVRRGVFNDVQTAYEDLLNDSEQISDLGDSVVAAEKAFDLADRLYKIGGGSNLDRLTAQDTLLNAQLALTNAKYAEKIDYLTLLRNSGLLRPDYPKTPVPTTLPATQPSKALP